MRYALLALVLAVSSQTLLAQGDNEPRRPRLPSQADTNDAEAYYEFGRDRTTKERDAYRAFYWAWRIDPTKPHYLFAQFRSYWARQSPQWQAFYLQGDRRVLRSDEAKRIDSLYSQVLMRDPFPRLPLESCLVMREVTQVRDPFVQGLYWYQLGCPDRAAQQWAIAVEQYPAFVGLRVDLARAYALSSQYPRAVAELLIAVDSLRQRDADHLRYEYESKAFLEYMLGVGQRRAGRLGAARASMERALVEDLGFYPAHVQLAELARARGDLVSAAREYEAALNIETGDPAIHYHRGVALLGSARPAEAEPLLRRTIEMEPYFAMGYLQLARALERQGKAEGAVEQYRAYIVRAPRRRQTFIREAEARIAALAEGP